MKQNTNPEIDVASLNEQIFQESLAMAKYALASGKRIPAGIIEIIQNFASDTQEKNAKNLILIHERLTRIIAPATPKTIRLLEMESAKRNRLKFLGLIPLARQIMLVAFLSLIIFIFCQSFDIADTTLDVMDKSGIQFLFIIFTFIASAGLGVSFVSLFQINKYITSGTYDPKYESSYWIRFVLGIIAGLTLSVLIPISKGGQASQLGRPLLAMLGGFSVNLVYRLLTRLVETVESLVTGSKEDALAIKEKELNIRAREEDIHSRHEVAASLMNIIQQIEPQTDPKQIKDKLQTLINDFYFKGNIEKQPEAVINTDPASYTAQDSTSSIPGNNSGTLPETQGDATKKT